MDSTYVVVGLAAVAALVVYLIVTHKVNFKSLGDAVSTFSSSVHARLAILEAKVSAAQAKQATAAATAGGGSAVSNAAPASTPLVANAPAVQPIAAAEPDTAAKIRALIIQWRANGADWPQVGLYLQSFGLGRPLTADEWNVAISAGFPKELTVVDHSGEGGAAFQLKPEMTFDESHGQAIAFQGSAKFKITGCPPRVAIWVFQHSGSFTDPYDVTVNGVTKHVTNPVVYDPIIANGPDVEVEVANGAAYWLNVNINAGG